jgi:predicted DNA-binding protein with PD1-like motif
MRSVLLHEANQLRTFGVLLDKGDEAVEQLTAFARSNEVTAAGLTAVGGYRQAMLGYFDHGQMRYLDIPVTEQVEVLSLIGDIAVLDDRPVMHAHAVLGHRDGSTVGGHLQRAEVWPTLEVIVTESPGHLAKGVDAETGLALLKLD